MCVTVIEIIFVSNPSWEEEHRDLVQRWPFTTTSSFSQGGILSARTISPTLLHPSSSCTEQRQAHQIFLHLSPWLLINNLKTGLANGCVSAEMPVIQMVTFFFSVGNSLFGFLCESLVFWQKEQIALFALFTNCSFRSFFKERWEPITLVFLKKQSQKVWFKFF